MLSFSPIKIRKNLVGLNPPEFYQLSKWLVRGSRGIRCSRKKDVPLMQTTTRAGFHLASGGNTILLSCVIPIKH